MDSTAAAVIAGSLLVWSLLSARLERDAITAPMTLLALGAAADLVGLVSIAPEDVQVGEIASAALALLLFSDAARINLGKLRRDSGMPGRLLLVGLPLTIVVGAVLYRVMDPAMGWGVALIVGACLAPTDAGLGAVIVTDPRVPASIRRTLNVESGLNDGIASPVVTIGIALAASAFHIDGVEMVSRSGALGMLAVGALVGAAVGALGGVAMTAAQRRELAAPAMLSTGALSLAVGSYALALSVDANGFIAAFVAGLAFAPAAHKLRQAESESEVPVLALGEVGGQLLGSVVWFLFGAALLGPVLEDFDVKIALYSLASLTVVRMIPVALSLIGARAPAPTVAFVGWFGPRGLASLVFALEAVDQLGEVGDAVLGVVGFTVLISVVAHGASAGPLASRYAAWCEQRQAHPPQSGQYEPLTRLWPHRMR